jgi:hypothetical protein
MENQSYEKAHPLEIQNLLIIRNEIFKLIYKVFTPHLLGFIKFLGDEHF